MMDEARRAELRSKFEQASWTLGWEGQGRLSMDVNERYDGRIDASVEQLRDGTPHTEEPKVLLRTYPNGAVELLGRSGGGAGMKPITNAEAAKALDVTPELWDQVRGQMQREALLALRASSPVAASQAQRATEAVSTTPTLTSTRPAAASIHGRANLAAAAER